jgi:hypothetical protein
VHLVAIVKLNLIPLVLLINFPVVVVTLVWYRVRPQFVLTGILLILIVNALTLLRRIDASIYVRIHIWKIKKIIMVNYLNLTKKSSELWHIQLFVILNDVLARGFLVP